ncbi:uncharacterized protein METZ01_LOCUS324679, partial [marine metagenome]
IGPGRFTQALPNGILSPLINAKFVNSQ